jgi:hypothetical protein
VKPNKYLYAGIGAAAVIIAIMILSYSVSVPSKPKTDALDLDFTYDEANSNLKTSLQSQSISMSSPLKFSKQADIEKYCNFFSSEEKQKLVEYCTSTEIKDAKGTFLGNIHIVGSQNAPGAVIAVLQTNPTMDNLDEIKIVFDAMTKELVCDCWQDVKPGGYDTIEKWVDALRDFHTAGDKPHSKAKPLELDSKHLQIELTTNKDGYLWKLLVAR